jgi:hypothetical protein
MVSGRNDLIVGGSIVGIIVVLALFASPFNFDGDLFGGCDDYTFGLEVAKNVVVDGQGNTIVVAMTELLDYPTTLAFVGKYEENQDFIVVTKFDPLGNLLWSLPFGGSKYEEVTDAAIDSNDRIIIVGWTTSSDFPVKSSNFTHYTTNIGSEPQYRGAFITVVEANGSMAWSHVLMGSNGEVANSLVVDEKDAITIVGTSLSFDFPDLGAPIQIKLDDGQSEDPVKSDVFLVTFNSTGNATRYIRMQGMEAYSGDGVHLDNEGNLIVVGREISPDVDLDEVKLDKAFVLKLSNNDLEWLTFIQDIEGTPAWQYNFVLEHLTMYSVMDSQNNLIISGSRGSDQLHIKNLFTPTLESSSNGFIIKLNPTGSIEWGTYFEGCSGLELADNDKILFFGSYHGEGYIREISVDGTSIVTIKQFEGNEQMEEIPDVVLDDQGLVYVFGQTRSTKFPMKNGYNTSISGPKDLIITVWETSNNEMTWGTYLGGYGETEYICE